MYNNHHLLRSCCRHHKCVDQFFLPILQLTEYIFVSADELFHYLWYIFYNCEFNIFYCKYHVELMPLFENLDQWLKKGSMMHESNDDSNNNFCISEGHLNKKKMELHCKYRLSVYVFEYVNLLLWWFSIKSWKEKWISENGYFEGTTNLLDSSPILFSILKLFFPNNDINP